MIRIIFSSLFCVALATSLGLLVSSTQPVSAGMTFVEGYHKYWPNGDVPVYISQSFDKFVVVESSGRISSAKKFINRGLSNWGRKTGFAVRFRQYWPLVDTRYVHIVTPQEYQNLTQDYSQGPCGSWGPQPEQIGLTTSTYIWLAPECINLPSILHESGHAIGLGHEHLRPDRDLYMSFDKWYVPDPIEDAPVGFFDYFSIMHSAPVLDKSKPRSPEVSWGTLSDLSEGDIDTVRALYAFDIQSNADIVGGDYADFQLVPTATQRDCQLACAADVRCKAYTYAPSVVLPRNIEDPHCFLKDDDSIDFSDRPGLTSGKRKSGQQGAFGVARHVDLFGGQIGTVDMPYNVLDGDNCKDLCMDDAKCDAFTFVAEESSGTCYKKSYKPDNRHEPPFTYQRQPNFMSGVVRIWKPKIPPLP